MKQLFLLLFASLLFMDTIQVFAQCTDDIVLWHQGQVNSFADTYGCSIVEGNLTIQSSIDDLTPLEIITQIDGDLIITGTDYLNNLDGLQNLTYIGGHLIISQNNFFFDLDGIENLTSIGEGLTISGHYYLTNIEGLQNLTSIAGDVWISENSGLTNLDGLQNLISIEDHFIIIHNDGLTSLYGIENLSVGGLSISDNNSLVNLDELDDIEIIGDLKILSNDSLQNIDGVQHITTVGGKLKVTSNNSILNVNGLQNIATVEGEVDIALNDNLQNVDGLQNLTFVGEDFRIAHNDNLTNIDGIQNIEFIGGHFRFNDNPIINTCCAILPVLEGVAGDIIIYDNLETCNSVEAIAEICTSPEIQALPFFDENENGIFDENEQVLHQGFTLSPSALYTFTDQSGVAHIYLEDFGEHELSINNNSLWEFNGTNNPVLLEPPFSDTLYYFPMIPDGNFVIQSVDLTSSITRCNQETNYWLSYQNKGTTINDGHVRLIPSNLVNLVSANPPVDSTAGDTLFWFYDDLYPTHSKQIHLIYEMPSVDEIGTQIAFEANTETSEGYSSRKTILSSELICAYDPNDKLHQPSGYGNENYTLFGDTLEYTIRFQNTGNDTAFTVIIEDELSDYLDLNTFRPIASSHNVETQIDATTRLATFTFNDIYLPDSFVNETASHGFVKYQILGNENLEENTIVENTANIFFDANPPIVTNTTNNQMVSVLPNLPILTASTNVVDFGTIGLEANLQPQILFIENPGGLDLIIENMEVEGTGFSAQIQNPTVLGQGSTMVLIYFNPSEAKIYQSKLIIYSNVGQLTVDLSGTAVLGTGLSSLSSHSIRLFPNPNEGLFYLESKKHKILSFQVINSLGETVLEEQPNSAFMTIDLSKMDKGLYFVSMQKMSGMTTQKILVQ